MDLRCLPVFQKQSVFLVGGIVSKRRNYSKFETHAVK